MFHRITTACLLGVSSAGCRAAGCGSVQSEGASGPILHAHRSGLTWGNGLIQKCRKYSHRAEILAKCFLRWEKLNLVRVYTKPKGKMPDYSSPVVLRSTKCTVEDFVSAKRSEPRPTTLPPRFLAKLTRLKHNQCNAIHRSILEQFKNAVVYGKSVKHQPQRVGLAHELADEDIGTYFANIDPGAGILRLALARG